jgi:hypothetical protein
MEMRPGPATPTAFVRDFLRYLITAWRRNDRFGPTVLPLSRATSATFAKASCPFLISRSKDLAITNWPSCGGQRSVLFRAQRATNRWGRRPLCPGNQPRLRAFSGMSPGDSPSRITRLPLALPQSFGKLRKLHVSLNPLSVSLLRPATQKSQLLVQKLWTLRLPCGRPRKTKNEYFREDSPRPLFQ